MILTIGIPTIHEREHQFNQLFNKLQNQKILIQNPDAVEIIYIKDNREISIGAKRQKLLEQANGDYFVMIDDDDDITDDYIFSILKAITPETDSVGFEIECFGTSGKTASASNRWNDWGDNVGGFDYVRTPYQKTPIKTSIAKIIGYKDIRFGEDYDFSKRLKDSGLIKNESYIPKVLYFYRYKFQDPKVKYGL
jgi:hypothetical protein